jgi:Iap family predicted aminopeptidase
MTMFVTSGRSMARVILFFSLSALSAGTFASGFTQPLPDASAQKAYGYLEQIAGRIGERAAGTGAETRSVEYIAGQFRSWGLATNVLLVRVPVWHERRARLWADDGHVVDLPARAIVFSGTTSAEGISGGFVDIGTASPWDLQGKDLKGKIVLVKRDVYIDYPDYWLTDRLVPLGISGMVFYSSPGRGAIPTAYFNFKRALKEPTPPSVDIRYEDAVRLVQMQPQRVSITVQADVEWSESHSVVGEIKGTSKPDEVIFVSAHDDSAYTSPGATDDGGGVAAVMELARAFSKGARPARTIRFIAWGGHELGLMGSEAYMRAHLGETDKMVALVNYDGLGSTLGTLEWTAAGDDRWVKFLRDTQKSLGMEIDGSVGPSGTDAMNFSTLEIPSIQIGQAHSVDGNHTPYDNLSTTSAVGLEEGLTLAGGILTRLANDTSLTFPHHFPAELLQEERDYAARWGWGIGPESDRAPNKGK